VKTDAHVQPVIASFPNPLGYRRQTLNTKPKSRRCERSAAAQEPEFEVMDGRASLAVTKTFSQWDGFEPVVQGLCVVSEWIRKLATEKGFKT
jgi:hypothetical protein